MSKFRVEKSLGQITGALKTLVEAVEAHQDLKFFENLVSKSYTCSINDVIPRVSMCFDSGLIIVSSPLWIILLETDLANSSSTDFPVSKTDDRRLLVNTSGITSVNI